MLPIRPGSDVTDYEMDMATADFNTDGWMDIYVTNLGPNKMLYNKGDETFTDVTEKTGTAGSLWSASASALDYDRDARLDLYVTNYVEFDLVQNKRCYAQSSRRDYCGPSAFKLLRDRLFHNRGDGTFEEVTDRI